MARRIGDVLPKLPVVPKESVAAPFYVMGPPSTFSGRYGASWRLPCVDAETGEPFLILFGGNDVRNHDFESLVTYFATNPTERIGPLGLAKTALKEGRETWELIDADPAPDSPPADRPGKRGE
jgi:hypothetical protein